MGVARVSKAESDNYDNGPTNLQLWDRYESLLKFPQTFFVTPALHLSQEA